MIIHEPQVIYKDGEITISSVIESKKNLSHLPKRLWFTFPEKYLPYLAIDRGEAFLISMLIPAMFYREEIEVRAPISPKLAYALSHYQALYQSIAPKKLATSRIHYQNLIPYHAKEIPSARCLAFSGGVDSTFTLLSHLPHSQHYQGLELTHALFIEGFYDITLDQGSFYQHHLATLTDAVSPFNIQMLQARTNVHTFTRYHLSWDYHHSAALLGVALMFSNLIGSFVKSTGNVYNEYPNTEVALGDHLIQTETFNVFNYGAYISRFEKSLIVSNWPPAAKFFRVCILPRADHQPSNCGTCRKCLLAMLVFSICGTAENLNDVLPPLTFKKLLRWWIFHGGLVTDERELIQQAYAYKKWGYWIFLVLLNPFRVLKRKIIGIMFSFVPDKQFPKLKMCLENISLKFQL